MNAGEALAAIEKIVIEPELTFRTERMRTRDAFEAPLDNTNAYASFMLAYGNARIGRPERARELVARGTTTIEELHDRVHHFLAAAFRARVDRAIAGTSSDGPLPEQLSSDVLALGAGDRYLVDRLREASRILAGTGGLDPIGHQFHGELTSELNALSRLTAEDRVLAILQTLEIASNNELRREPLLDVAFHALVSIDRSAAAQILRRSLAIVGDVPAPQRALLYAKAMVVAEYADDFELIGTSLDWLRSVISEAGPTTGEALGLAVGVLCRGEHRREMVELAMETHATNLDARLALAAGLAWLGDTTTAEQDFEAGRRKLELDLTLNRRLELVRALSFAYAQAPTDIALPRIVDLGSQFTRITDNYSTNTHFCLSVLHFVDALVFGVVLNVLRRPPA